MALWKKKLELARNFLKKLGKYFKKSRKARTRLDSFFHSSNELELGKIGLEPIPLKSYLSSVGLPCVAATANKI